jgi:hypothetical protein
VNRNVEIRNAVGSYRSLGKVYNLRMFAVVVDGKTKAMFTNRRDAEDYILEVYPTPRHDDKPKRSSYSDIMPQARTRFDRKGG